MTIIRCKLVRWVLISSPALYLPIPIPKPQRQSRSTDMGMTLGDDIDATFGEEHWSDNTIDHEEGSRWLQEEGIRYTGMPVLASSALI